MGGGFQIGGFSGPVQHAPGRRNIPMEQRRPYVLLYAIDIPSSPRTKLRATPYPESVNFERDSNGDVITYSPMDIGHGEVQRNTEGKVPTLTLEVQNVTQEASALLELYNGLVGEKVRIVLIHKDDLPDGTPVHDDTYEILESEDDEGTVRLQIGQYSLFKSQFPARRLSRVYCAHRYGREGCGYDTARPGALQTCSKLRKGDNGCEEHGDDEVAAGLARRHPKRMLVFEGIRRTSGVGVS